MPNVAPGLQKMTSVSGLQRGHEEDYCTSCKSSDMVGSGGRKATEPGAMGVEEYVLDVVVMLKVPTVTGQNIWCSGHEIVCPWPQSNLFLNVLYSIEQGLHFQSYFLFSVYYITIPPNQNLCGSYLLLTVYTFRFLLV